jgi:hypothetical protein
VPTNQYILQANKIFSLLNFPYLLHVLDWFCLYFVTVIILRFYTTLLRYRAAWLPLLCRFIFSSTNTFPVLYFSDLCYWTVDTYETDDAAISVKLVDPSSLPAPCRVAAYWRLVGESCSTQEMVCLSHYRGKWRRATKVGLREKILYRFCISLHLY